MREFFTYGSVRGAAGNGRPYRVPQNHTEAELAGQQRPMKSGKMIDTRPVPSLESDLGGRLKLLSVNGAALPITQGSPPQLTTPG